MENNDLMSLALRAAMEVDDLLRKTPATNDFRNAFANRLQSDVHASNEGTVKIRLSPTTTSVVARTMQEFDVKPTNDLELSKMVEEFTKELKELDSKTDENKLGKIKNLCLQLHKQLLTEYRNSRIERNILIRHG